MATKQCDICDERIEGLCAQDAWGRLKSHAEEEHGMEWDVSSREWVLA